MVKNRDRDQLAEEWHRLLCEHDPEHPEFVSTPIAPEMDAYTLAYAILLIKEGIFNQEKYDVNKLGCRCCPDDVQSIKTELLDHLLGGAITRMKQAGSRRRPMSATPNFREMSDRDRIGLLTKIYGHGRPSSPKTPPGRFSRLYERVDLDRINRRHKVPELDQPVDWSFPTRPPPKGQGAGWPWNGSKKGSTKGSKSSKPRGSDTSYGEAEL